MHQLLPSVISSQTHDYNIIGVLGKGIISFLFNSLVHIPHFPYSGAFATVYTANNFQTNEKVAIKVIEKQSIASYNREADIHLLLNHINVIQLKDTIETDTFIFYVFEWCEMDLFQAIDGSGVFSFQVIFEVFNQILDGMIYCHSRFVFHRDLKPENVLIAKDFSVRICDFGLATCNDWSFDYGSGSIRYMSPERFIDKTKHGLSAGYSAKKGDVWSIGIILFNMTTGKNPWHSATLNDPNYATYLKCPEYLTIEHHFSDEFHTLLKRILDPNPHTRITLLELQKEFNQCDWFNEMSSSDDDYDTFISPNTSISSQITRVNELLINTSLGQMSYSEASR